jgi:hypothetical protein
MSLTIETSNALIDHLYKNNSFTSPPQVWMGLIGSNDSEFDSGQELGYSRVELGTKLTEPSNRLVVNFEEIIFVQADSQWEVNAVGFWTAQTAGDLLQIIPLEAPLTVQSGAALKFPAGSIQLGIASDQQVIFSTSIAFSGVSADGVPTLIASFYNPESLTLKDGEEGSLALIGGVTQSTVATLSLVPLGEFNPIASWQREGLLGSAQLVESVVLPEGWYDIVLSSDSNLAAFARGIYLKKEREVN